VVGFILTLIFGAGVEVFLNEGFIIRVPVRAFHRHAALRQSYLRNGKTRSQGSDTPSLAAAKPIRNSRAIRINQK